MAQGVVRRLVDGLVVLGEERRNGALHIRVSLATRF